MAVRQFRNELVYGIGQGTLQHHVRPIVANRAPTSADHGPLGQIWVDKSAQSIYMLAKITAGAANWTTSPASGVGTFTAATINPGDVTITAGDAIISAGDLTVTSGNTTLGGNLTVTGTTALNGDIDFSSAALIDLISSLDAAPSILLHANGGVSEQIYLHSDQGTAVNSILLGSDVGGITLTSGLASADAINITASNAAGGIDIDSGTGGTILDSTGAISLDAAVASNFSTSGAGIDLTLASAAGRVIVDGGEDAAQVIYLHADAGVSETVDIHSDQGTGVASINVHSDVGGVTLTSGLASADAINIVSSNAGGGIDIDSGTAGTILDSTGAISLDAAAASNFSTSGAGIDLTLASAAGRVIVDAGEDAADAIYLHADAGISETIRLHSDQGTGVASIGLVSDVGGISLTATALASDDAINLSAPLGGVDIDGALQVNIASSEAVADAIVLSASAGGIDISATGSAGVDIDLLNTGGSVNLTATEDAALAIYLRANGGVSETVDIHSDQGTGVSSVNIHSDLGGVTIDSGLASADAINLNSSNAGGGIDIDSGTAGTILDSTGAISLDAAAASNFSTSGAGIDLTLASAAGRVIVDAGEDAADAIYLHADAGVSETIHIHSDQGTGVASVNIASDVGGLTLSSGLASADAININASDAAGGIDIDSGTAGVIVDTTGGISLDSAAASNFTATGAFDVTLSSTAGSMIVDGGEAVTDAVQLTASNAAGGVTVAAGTGGIHLNAAGFVDAVDGTATAANPTAAVTINTNIGTATFSSYTYTAGITKTFTINNSLIGTTSSVLVTVSNLGSNDAKMTLERVKQASGSMEVSVINNGAAALNGNIVISFWVFNP